MPLQPGQPDYWTLPVSQRKSEFDHAQWAAGGLNRVPAEAYFTPTELAFFAAQQNSHLASWQTDVSKKYPSWAPYLQEPELAKVLQQAAKEGWPANVLQSHLEQTVWWKTHSTQQRQWHLLNVTDPASALQSVQQQYSAIFDKSRLIGLNLSSGQMMALASRALDSGWNDQQLTDQMVNSSKGHYDHGTMGATRDQLKGIANDYLMPASDHTLDEWTRRVTAGTASPDIWKDQMMRQAQSRYQDPGIKDALQHGMTVRDFADPYVQQAAQTLGVNPNDIDLLQNKWNRPLDYVDPKTQTKRAMTMDEWDTHIKMNPTYGYDSSHNGVQAAADMISQIRDKFGMT